MALIGGSGLNRLDTMKVVERHSMDTPWGRSAPASIGEYANRQVLFLPRHGDPHVTAPHQINYRANLYALRQLGAKRIIAINAVGGISPAMKDRHMVIPDQIIDYTWGRASSFDGHAGTATHIDFSYPYDEALRKSLLRAGQGLSIIDGGVHGVTQGPRLETAAEIRRMKRDGCDIVGMTGMPEAALARELEMDYACCAMVVNPAAGTTAAALELGPMQENIVYMAKQVLKLVARCLLDRHTIR